MKKYIPVLFFLFSFGVNSIHSQDYKAGVGLRGGWLSGITGKYFIKDGRAIEGIFSSGWGFRGYQLTGLYEFHKEAFSRSETIGFFWYYGGGAHLGGGYSYLSWHVVDMYHGYWDKYHYATFGVDGIFGLEYKIEELPITISLDIKPFIEFSGYRALPFHFWDAAFSIRYIFEKEKKKE